MPPQPVKNTPHQVLIKTKHAGVHEDETHGGIWKMVYADFMTALMAFFLVMWLATTSSEAQRDLLADYFNPVSVSREKSGADGVLGGRATESEGALSSPNGPSQTSLPVAAPPVIAELGEQNRPPHVGVEMTPQQIDPTRRFSGSTGDTDQQLKALEEQLRIAFSRRTDPENLRDVIVIERLTDAVYIQIADDEAFSMFDTGSARLRPDAEALFEILGSVLTTVPHTVRLTGHTDSSGFRGRAGGTDNWGLSASRANAARRVMERAGLSPDRIEAVQGKADRELLLPDRPLDPRNRRITVSVLADVSPSSDLFFSADRVTGAPR